MPGKKNKRLRVVLDSNVLISAVVFGGKPREILERVFRGELTLIVSPAILDEVESVLGGEKFRFSGDAARVVVQEIESLAEIVKGRAFGSPLARGLYRRASTAEVAPPAKAGAPAAVDPATAVSVVPDDPDDNQVISCALDGGAGYLVSGDFHLLKIGQYKALPILSRADFLAALAKRSPSLKKLS